MPGVDATTRIQAHRRRLVGTMQYFTRFSREGCPRLTKGMALLLVADVEIYRLDGAIPLALTLPRRE